MAANEHTLTEEQLATISANILHQTLIECRARWGSVFFVSSSPAPVSRSLSCGWRMGARSAWI